jgi:integrase/recombinase XerD
MKLVETQGKNSLFAISGEPFDIDRMLAGQLGASSIAMYKRDVKAYQTFCTAKGYIPLDPQTLALWRDQLALAGNMSPNTINRMLSAVKRVIKEASVRNMIDSSLRIQFNDVPGVKLKAMKDKLKKNSRTRISREDMRRICTAPSGETIIGTRDRALLATLASSGVRASELATLTVDQIERRGRGYVLQVCGKTDTEYRDANLSLEAKSLIDIWLATRPIKSPYVFTSFSTRAALPSARHISETGVWLIVQKYAKQCEIGNIKPHDFRRFVGTELAKIDIRKAQKALGHKSIEVTARHYVLDDLEIGQTDSLY